MITKPVERAHMPIHIYNRYKLTRLVVYSAWNKKVWNSKIMKSSNWRKNLTLREKRKHSNSNRNRN